MKMTKCLITGGAGFIGSHIIENLLNPGQEVVCLDNFDAYYSPRLKGKNTEPFRKYDRFKLVKDDIRDKVPLNRTFEGVEYIFHEAAQAEVRTSVEIPMKPHEVNATGTLNLLESVLDSDIRKFRNASSSVYGRVEYLPFDEFLPEQLSPYGVSRLLAKHYCRVFEEDYGLKNVSLCYFTVYGPRMRPDFAINIFTKAALKNEHIIISGIERIQGTLPM